MEQRIQNWYGAGLLAWRLISVLLLSIVLMGSAATAHAQTDRIFINEIVPFEQEWYNECAGEYIQFTGSLHIVFFEQIGPSGNAVYKSQVNPQAVSGYGEVTGTLYRGTGMSQGISTVKDVNNTYTSINNMNFVGPGKGNNMVLHTLFHITVNANGEVSTVVENDVSKCN